MVRNWMLGKMVEILLNIIANNYFIVMIIKTFDLLVRQWSYGMVKNFYLNTNFFN